jgi:hypothetical protein
MNRTDEVGIYAIIDGRNCKVQNMFTSVDGKTHEVKMLCPNGDQKIIL